MKSYRELINPPSIIFFILYLIMANITEVYS